MAGNNDQMAYKFGSTDSLREVTEQIDDRFEAQKKDSSDSKVLCMLDDGDEWLRDWDRTPIVVFENGEPITASAVSERDKYYTPVQFHEPFEGLVHALESREGWEVAGEIIIGKFRKKLTSEIKFSNLEAQDPTGNSIELGLRIKTAHTGFQAVKIDIGAERLVCKNGLVAWDSEFRYTHEHNEGEFRESIFHQVLDAIEQGGDIVEGRFNKAHEERLGGKQALLLLLLDTDIRGILENPESDLREAFEKEMEWHNNPHRMENNPSLYDAYMVGTYAIDHLAKSDVSEHHKGYVREQLTTLIENYNGEVPEANNIIARVVENRTEELVDSGEERWEGESELVQEVSTTIPAI